MTRIIEDGIVETATTTGTGDFTLAGAAVGYRTFASVCSVGNEVFYVIEAIDVNGDRTGAWEVGDGDYSAANTLTRTTVRASSNAGALVNFAAGTKRVTLSLTAWQVKFRGALTKKAADQTAANFTAVTAVVWDTDTYDTDAFHDTGVNTSRMTIPAGVNYVRLRAGLNLALVTADVYTSAMIYKNGSASYAGFASASVESGITTPSLTVSSPVLSVAEADYFEVFLLVETDTSITITAATSWFALEVVE